MVVRVVTICVCCLVALPVSAVDELWEWVTPWPQGHSLRAVAAGNGVMVAVGVKGSIIAGADGIHWRVVNSTTDYDLYDVIWANHQFVAIGWRGDGYSTEFGVILTSADGFHWVELHRIDHSGVGGVAWDGERFVAAADTILLLSSDGDTWVEEALSEEISSLWDLVWDGTRFVAVGESPDETLSAFTSEDALSWQSQPFDCECYPWGIPDIWDGLYCEYYPAAIAWGSGRYVAVGGGWEGNATALVSIDALSWEEQTWEGIGRFNDVVFGRDGFLAVGDDGLVASSVDGYVWSFQDPPTDFDVWGVTEMDGGYLAVGEDGFMMSSPEGSEWTQLSTKSFDLSGSWEINELAKGGSMIVGVGEVGVIITSRHGTEWVQRSSPTESELHSVIWTGSAFWTAGSNGVLRSIDGVHWVQMLLDHDLRLFDIVWNGSLFVAVGRHSTFVDSVVETRDIILMSPDGHDWSSQFFDLDGNLFTVGWTGSQFVAAGSGSYYLTSPDGMTWQQRTQAEDLTLTDMAWNGDRLVAVGGRWEAGGVIRSTEDGTHWVESALPEDDVSSFDDVTWTGTHFVAVSRSSGDVVFSSPEGLTWSSETTGTGVWPVSVVGDDRSLYVTGRGLSIIRRTEPLQGPAPPRRPDRRVSPAVDSVRTSAPILRKDLLH